MNWLRNPGALWANGYSVIRIFLGITLIYHGKEVFDAKLMGDYGKWLTDLHFPAPAMMAYLGKGSEFIGGVLLALGLFTRAACVFLCVTFLSIAFFMGHGKIFMEDQHPFMYVLFCLIFIFSGAGNISFDSYFWKEKN
jgi:putative oxidoreductase